MKRNAVHCNHCDTTIESLHRHDFRRCRCTDDDTAVWVDGGFDYTRRMWGDHANYTEIDEEYVEPEVPFLEHTTIRLQGAHHPSRCAGDFCTLHNRSTHSKRSWVQSWDGERGMRRIHPRTGQSYRDPDELPRPAKYLW